MFDNGCGGVGRRWQTTGNLGAYHSNWSLNESTENTVTGEVGILLQYFMTRTGKMVIYQRAT